MPKWLDRLLDEPVLVTKFFESLIATLVAFNLPLTDEQRTAVLGLIGASIALSVAVRRAVTPVRKLRREGGE